MHDIISTYVERGLVGVRRHPTLPLSIYNYTDEATYSRTWDDVTRMCRGLILDDDGTVVARPFPKFFNYEEHVQFPELGAIPNEPFVAYDKMDGSLIIVVEYKGQRVVASRGSFESDQARWADEILDEMKAGIPRKGYTFLFELIHPENRIVVDYGSRRKLIHLGTTDTATGKDALPWCMCGFDHPQVWKVEDTSELPVRENAEGYVLRFESGFRVKVKFEDYVRLHKLIFGINHNVVFRAVRDGDYDLLVKDVPEEFREWMDDLAGVIRTEFDSFFCGAWTVHQRLIESLPEGFTRGDYAREATQTDIPDLLFACLDENREKLDSAIWRRVERWVKDNHNGGNREALEATV